MTANKPSPQPGSTKVKVVVIKALQKVLNCVYTWQDSNRLVAMRYNRVTKNKQTLKYQSDICIT